MYRHETNEQKRLKQMKQSDRIEYLLLHNHIQERWDMGNFLYNLILLVAIGVGILTMLAAMQFTPVYMLYHFIKLSILLIVVAIAFQFLMWIGELNEKKRLYAEFEERCFSITPKK